MSLAPKDPLLTAGRIVVLIGQAIMVIALVAIAIAIPALLMMQSSVAAEFAQEFPDAKDAFPLFAILVVMLLACALLAMGWLFLRHMRRIIDTVGEGDPFVPENAERLTAMGWIALAAQIVSLPAAGLALYITNIMDRDGGSINVGIDGYAVVLIITLFILARVFRHGAAMRDDLEGTV